MSSGRTAACRRLRVVAAAALLLPLAACSGSSGSSALPSGSTTTDTRTPAPATATAASPTSTGLPTAGTTKSPIRWYVKTTGNSKKDSALLAVQEYWSMMIRLSEKPGSTDPEIGAITANPQRSRIERAFSGIKQVQRGPVVASLTPVSATGSKARVDACLDMTLVQRYSLSGLRLSGTGYLGREYFQVSVQIIGDSWKVYNQHSPNGSTCVVDKSRQ